ncbi:ribose-phosphate pyrophosphokinase [Gammaproteobacteria bacterium]|jgi:ribose-phosphate pyrophosphokinase|nr:ribose-phosphate pyrophosphokinase [Gammaproteobacteria bacterium]
MKLFSGSANGQLAESVAKLLGIRLGHATIGRFSDGEIMFEIHENVRGSEVFIIQSICHPCNDHLMELVVMADAIRRASASSITAVVPYFGYARQDRRVRSKRVPITSKIVADMLTSVGFSRLITVDLHAEQIQGFFHMPVDNIYASPVLLADIQSKGYQSPAVVSPDVGGVVRARAFAKCLPGSELVIIDKRRPANNQSEVMNVIGQVKDRHCLIIDDILDTAGTACQAARVLTSNGAASVSAYCAHPVLSGPALENIEQSPLKEVVVGDTIPLPNDLSSTKIRQVSIKSILAETILRVSHKQSVSSMFNDE